MPNKIPIMILACLALIACTPDTNTSTPPDNTLTDVEAVTKSANIVAMTDNAWNVPGMLWDPAKHEVKTTASGLQYIVISKGSKDGLTPSPRDRVSVMYEGRLLDGTMFDSAYERGTPSTFGTSEVIAGWTEGLQLMSEGDEFLFYIPSELAYGQNPRPGGLIKPGDDLVFRVKLNEVLKAPEARPVSTEAWQTHTPWDSTRPNIQKTGTGLEYVILENGATDGSSPRSDDVAVVYYEGRLDDGGVVFDSAFQRGEVALIPVNQVIPGWVEALSLMKPGDRWLIHLPSDLAYGGPGRPPVIPPDAALNFEIELIDIVPNES